LNNIETPKNYTFDKTAGMWKKHLRGGNSVIGRMLVISIQDSEHYYLCILLARAVGAQSFQDLRTVNEIECDTFQQACQQLCLLKGYCLLEGIIVA
jgi:hypothetical protein